MKKRKKIIKTPHLELFYYPECPFCQLVLEAIEDLSIDLELSNTRKDKEAFKKLVADTGKKTVPCLYIDGTPMHESSDIIDWLKKNQHMLKKRPS